MRAASDLRRWRPPRPWLWLLASAMPACLAAQSTLQQLTASEHHGVVEGTIEGSAAVATWLGDAGHVSVFSFEGDYSRYFEGSLNVAPRATVAQEFLTHHADAYDFLIVFTGFPFESDAPAFHLGVRNEVEGIGLQSFDESAAFGSDGVIGSYIDMGSLDQWEADPLDPDFETSLTVLLHEIFHQWGAYVSVDLPGVPPEALRMPDGLHWSFLLDSDASVLYGNDWLDHGDGSFTSRDMLRVLSPLDLYLGGFYGPDEVPPWLLIDNPGIDPGRLPETNATIEGAGIPVSIAQVIAAEGPRIPAAVDAPKQLRAGFLFLAAPGQEVTEGQRVALENLRSGLLSRFVAVTGGRGRIEIFPVPIGEGGGGPGGVGGGDIRPTSASVLDALAWLREAQRAAGYWQDRPSTRVRESAVALNALNELDPLFGEPARLLAEGWLGGATPLASDLLARQAGELPGAEGEVARSTLALRQNLDGGWGLDAGFESNPFDTALVMSALSVGYEELMTSARSYLLNAQNPDGGWSMGSRGPSHLAATVAAMVALPGEPAAVSAGIDWLASKQNADGGFGDSPSTAHGTALALNILADFEALAVLGDGLAAAQGYLMSRQEVAGSWEGSVYTTALVAKALQRLTLPNLHFADQPIAVPASPVDGETVELQAVVGNDGAAIAPASVLRGFDGNPDGAGTPIGEELIPLLGPGQSALVSLYWDTHDLPGAHELFLVLDPDGATVEVSEADNRVVLPLEVGGAPPDAELAISPGGITVSPPAPDRLPTLLSVSATIINLGVGDAIDVQCALFHGEPANGEILEETTVTILGRSSIGLNFSVELSESGTTIYTVVADSQGGFDEADETNNTGSVSVSTVPSVDLEVLDSDLTIAETPIYRGQDAAFTVVVHNYGTTDSPVAQLSYEVTDGVTVETLTAPTVIIPAGGSVERAVLWRADLTGDLTFSAQVDADDSVPETDETNNRGDLFFQVQPADQPNLTIGYADLTVDLAPAWEGSPLTLSAVIRNTGPTDLSNVEVAFFDGDPEADGVAIGTPVTLTLLAAGDTAIAETVWPTVPDPADRVLVVQADPADAIPELDETDNETFLEIEVASLPDLAVSPALIDVDPPLPAPGQPATVTVTVQNLGQQGTESVGVRVLEGDLGSALPIDSDQIVDVNGDGAAVAIFGWDVGTGAGPRTITAIVDSDDAVAESEESNNSASLTVGVQEGGFVVLEPLFSPNGDGVLDAATMLFELDTAQTVRIEVVDSARGRVVRTESGPDLENVISGEFVWDGRGDEGFVVRDADFALRVLDEQNALLGQGLSTVDTNRSSLFLAIGTEFEAEANLTCRANPENYLVPASEDWGYFSVTSRPTAEFPKGLYRSRLDASEVERVISETWLGADEYIHHFTVSPDGSRLAFRVRGSAPGSTVDELWVANSNGNGLFELVTDDPAVPLGTFWSLLGISGSNGHLLVAAEAGLVGYDLDGVPNPRIVAAPGLTYGSFSPGQRHLQVFDPDRDVISILDLDSGVTTDVYSSAGVEVTWSPEGSRLAVTDGGEIHIVTPRGELLQTLLLPGFIDGDRPFQSPDPNGVAWSFKTAELATIGGYLDNDSCFDQRVLLTIDLETGDTTEWARSEPGLPCQIGAGVGDSQRAEGREPGGTYDIDQFSRVFWDPADRSLVTSERRVRTLGEDDEWRQLSITGSNDLLTQSGRYWLYDSQSQAVDSSHPCYSNPGSLSHRFAIRSLMNLSVRLSAVRPPYSDGVELSGTASDLHFARRSLQWSEAEDPYNWHPLGTPSTLPIVDELITTWLPPYPGVFRVRLTGEDGAGNTDYRERRVVSSTSPMISGVEVAPALISPNGDSILDEAVVAYDVEAPTVVLVRVVDQAGGARRTFERIYPSGGTHEVIAWDGRDEDGVVVPDGEYRVLVNQYEFPVSVDTSPPTALFRAPEMTPAGELDLPYQLADLHPGTHLFERGEGEVPGVWLPLPSGCREVPHPTAPILECDRPEHWVGRRFRLTATDAGGNSTSAQSELAEQVIWMTGFGPHRVDPETGLFEPLEPPAGHEFEEGPVRFGLTDLVIDGLVQVFAQFRVRPANDEDPPWSEVALSEFFAPGSIVPLTAPPDPFFEVVWDQAQLLPELEYELRIKAIDGQLQVYYSNAVVERVLAAESLTFDALAREPYPAPVLLALAEAGVQPREASLVTGSSSVTFPLSGIESRLWSSTDEGYLTPRTFELLVTVDGVFFFLVDPLLSCNEYSGRVSATLEDPAGERRIESSPGDFRIACMSADIQFDRLSVGECGSGPVLERLVTVVPRNFDQTTTLAELVVEVSDSGGESEEILRVSQPPVDTEHYLTIDTTAYPEGHLEVRTTLTNSQGEESSRAALLPIDRAPPLVEILVPQRDARVCGARYPPPIQGSYLEVLGSVEDPLGVEFALELGQGLEPLQWSRLTGALEIDEQGRASANGEPLMRGDDFGPVLATIRDRAGTHSLRLRALDNAGYLVCDQRSFLLDLAVEGAQLNLASPVFSPNGDGILDIAGISLFSPVEVALVEVEIYPGHLDPDSALPVITGPRTLVVEEAVAVDGLVALEWDGLDEAGVPAPEGSYLVISSWTDACPNSLELVAPLRLQTTAPEVTITAPIPGTPLPIVVNVRGTVAGYGVSWLLEYAGVGGPDDWVPIASGEGERSDEWLHDWRTFGLDGGYLLRLRAFDRAGNEGSHEIALDFNDRLALITNLEVVPTPFSPNGDGIRDLTAVRYELAEPAAITLRVVGDEGRTLADETKPAGAHLEAWDGLADDGSPLPDGAYEVRLVAELVADPSVVQIETAHVTVDRESPSVEIPVPRDQGVVRSSAHVFGSITDPNLESYSVSLDGDEVDSASTERVDHVFSPLDAYGEGDHALSVLAADRAGNETVLLRDFVIDDTAPEVSLTVPSPNDLLGDLESPHQVLGLVFEPNLGHWELEFGSGADPVTWTPLTSSVEQADGLLASWDVSALDEGLYVLRLSAVDLAANSGSVAVPVLVDVTSPTVEITLPGADSWVLGPTDVVGSVADLNLESYDLAVAPSGTSSFAVFDMGSEPVTGGVLGVWSALPPDGDYDLRLQATDRVGHAATIVMPVRVDTDPPSPPAGLAATLEYGHDAHLQWYANSESDVVGYHVYRDGLRITTAALSDPGYVDPGLSERTYLYRVSALDEAGHESDRSIGVEVVVDLTAPATLLLEPADGTPVSGVVAIEGTAHSPNDFSEFRVYARDESGNSRLLRASGSPVQSDFLASWNTDGLEEGAVHVLRLEADDIHGNTGVDEATVLVDNLAPDAPTNLVAEASDNDAAIAWDANSESDLLGYLLFRDDRLVNAEGSVDDFRPYALPGAAYDDVDLPDGTFEYVVFAIDQAGNVSLPSEPDSVTLDNHPPRAEIYQPDDGLEFEAPLLVRAESGDEDIASVQIQYRLAGDPLWIDLGAELAARPFDAPLDPANEEPALAFGEYELRAVATDENGSEDPAPPVVVVTYADLTAPEAVDGLVAVVAGENVSLSWDPVSDPDLLGYRLYRATEGTDELITDPPTPDTSYEDLALASGRYVYRVTAVDGGGNESDPPAVAEARIYTPLLAQPWTPTHESEIDLDGVAEAGAIVSGEVVNGTVVPLDPVEADVNGGFRFVNVPLAPGANEIRVTATDLAGNSSKEAQTSVTHGDPPAMPTDLAAQVDGFEVELSWMANPEDDIAGYRPFRDGEPLLPDSLIGGLSATASSSSTPPAYAVDGDPATSWGLGSNEGEQWLEVEFPTARQLLEIRLTWEWVLVPYRVEIWSGDLWLTALAEESDSTTVTLRLDEAYRTDRLRVVVDAPFPFAAALAEVEPIEQPTQTATTFLETTTDGTFQYAVTAVNGLGFESDSSIPFQVEVGDVLAPAPVALTAALVEPWFAQLDWSASSAPDLEAYSIYRDGLLIALSTDLASRSFLDGPLSDGTYEYLVRAVDAAGNESPDSNLEEVAIDVGGPAPPEDLVASPVPPAGVIDLSWSDGPGQPPAAYEVRRAALAGGPYTVVATVVVRSLRDSSVEYGERYHYVVVGKDLAGNESVPSNEASAVLGVPPPTLHFPALPGGTTSTEESLIRIAGSALPGFEIELSRSGEVVAIAVSESVDQAHVPSVGASEERPVLSPDGDRIWLAGSNGPGVYTYGNDSFVPTPELGGRPRWFSDSRRLVYAVGPSGVVRQFDVDTETTTDLVTLEVAHAAVPAVATEGLLLVGSAAGVEGLHLFDGSSLSLVHSMSLADLDADSVVWSPDESHVAYRRFETVWHLEVVDLATGTTTSVAPTQVGDHLSWSPDSRTLAFSSNQSGWDQLWRYEVDGGGVEVLPTGGGFAPSWSPEGQRVAFVREALLEVLDLASDGLQPLSSCGATCRPQWTRSGHLLAGQELVVPVRWTLAGHIEFENVSLGPDENEFRATQRAPNGEVSPDSRAMSVVRVGGDFPDLAILEDGLVAVPPITQSGVPVELFVTVRNVGSVASPASEVAIAASGPEGYYQQLESVELAPLAPGDSRTQSALVSLGGAAGVYLLGAEVDSLDAIAEIDESNNEGRRELGVVGEPGGSLLALTLARESVAFEQDLEATISVLHAGESMAALLRVVIEDELGGQVGEILDVVVSLDYAQQIDLSAVWNAEDTFAGNYRVRAVLMSESGVELASKTANFVILAFSRLVVDISTDRATYEIGDQVEITSQLDYESGNALLAGLLATTTLLGADGSEVVNWSLALGDLLPGTSLSLPQTWDSGGIEDGLYQLRFEVSGDVAEAASAEAAFVLLAPELSVEGSLTLEPDEVGLPATFVAAFSILNQTATVFESAPVRVRIFDPGSGEVEAEQSALLDLPPAVPVVASFGFDSSSLGLGDHFAVLVVDLTDGAGPPVELNLDGSVLRVLDLEPPDVELRDPESDGYVPADSRIVARATDALSTVKDVDVSLDDGPWLAMQPLDPEVGTYYRQLTGVLEGSHSVRARASDTAGNSSATETRSFTLDATAPAIVISGVDDDGTYAGQVAPVIAVVESHPDSQSTTLNDAPYESGTPISEPGAYLLAATASDLAGNESAETVRFTLTPPTGGLTLVVNSVNDVDDGLCSEQHCSLREAILATYGDPELSIIEFDIASIGPMVIRPRTELPPLITTVVIDGLSGPGAACTPRQLLVGLDGSLLTGAADGLKLQADDSTIRGLSIANFPGSAIRVEGSRDQLMCNHLGIDLADEPGGNQGSGVLIDGASAATLVGGMRSSVAECGGDCNWIAFNDGSGITVAPTALGGHRFRQNRILNNGQLAIDLGGDGVSWNDYPDDADEGPNDLLNFPALTRVVPSSPSQITVSYYGLPDHDLEVEFYANEVINAGVAGLAQDPPVGELDQLVGVTLLSTDETGFGSVEVSVPFDLTNRVMTATAIDLGSGSTSEASVAFLAHFTHALIGEVDALVVEGEGSLAWQTRSEAGTMAFEILRRRRGRWESATAPVPALSDAPQGSWYRARVDGLLPEVAEEFVLVELGSADTRTVHGPFHVIPRMSPGLARLEAAYERLPRALGPTSPGGGRKAVSRSSASSRDTLKIATTSRGIVRLDSTTIASNLGTDEGEVVEKIAAGELSLSLGGEPVAWWKSADGSAIFFLSESGPPLLTAHSVHLLQVGAPGLLAEFEPPVPVDIPDDQVFWDQASFDEDILPATVSALDPTEDYWFWKGLLAGSPMDGSVALMFALEEAIQDTEGNLTVTLYGATSVGPDEHRAQISVNGEVVADEVWEGRGWHTITAALQPGILGTDNEVQITALEQPGVDLSIFFLDRFDVKFRRHSRTSKGSLQRPGADGENFAKVSGLPSPDIRVLDTFIPGRPRLFLAPLVLRETDGFSVSFRSRGAEHSYFVDSAGLGEVTPLWVEAAKVWPARDGADYAVVAPFDWLESLEPLIALRQAQGLRVAAIAVEEIYDRLSFGIPNPAVFRHLLASQEQLGIEGVSSLVIAGAGTLDPLDNLGLGGHAVPAPLGGSLHGLYAADSLIADVDGDGIADVPVGRIPATTRAELEAYIAKAVAYESQAAQGWMNTVVALADDRDGPADFGEDLRRWAEQLPPDLAVVSITLDDSDTDSARSDLFDALGAGAGALYYVGHGGSTQLAEEGLLTIEDVAVLAQGSRVPFLSALTCVANRFEIPGLASIGGALTLDPDGGAIAVWSSTAVSQHGAAVGLGEAFARAVSAPDAPPTLGEAIQRAYRDSLASGGSPEHLSFYTLLGDPALPLRVGEMEVSQAAED